MIRSVSLMILASTMQTGQAVIVQDVIDFSDPKAMNASKLVRLNTSGSTQLIAAHEVFKYMAGAAITQKCIWTSNYIDNPYLQKNASKDLIESASCYNISSKSMNSMPVKDARLYRPSVNSDGTSTLFMNGYAPEFVRISDKLNISRRKFTDIDGIKIFSIIKNTSSFAHLDGWYYQIVDISPLETAVMRVKEDLKGQAQIYYNKGFRPVSIGIQKGKIVVAGEGKKSAEAFSFDTGFKTPSKALLSCPAKTERVFFGKDGMIYSLGSISNKSVIYFCNGPKAGMTAVEFKRGMSKVIMEGGAFFALPSTGDTSITIAKPGLPVKTYRIGESIVDIM